MLRYKTDQTTTGRNGFLQTGARCLSSRTLSRRARPIVGHAGTTQAAPSRATSPPAATGTSANPAPMEKEGGTAVLMPLSLTTTGSATAKTCSRGGIREKERRAERSSKRRRWRRPLRHGSLVAGVPPPLFLLSFAFFSSSAFFLALLCEAKRASKHERRSREQQRRRRKRWRRPPPFLFLFGEKGSRFFLHFCFFAKIRTQLATEENKIISVVWRWCVAILVFSRAAQVADGQGLEDVAEASVVHSLSLSLSLSLSRWVYTTGTTRMAMRPKDVSRENRSSKE